MARLVDSGIKQTAFIQSDTEAIIQREKTRQHKLESSARMRWKKAAELAINHVRSKRHYQDNMAISRHEHMSGVDSFDGEKMRGGKSSGGTDARDEDLLVIHPVVDGRLKDVGREA
jgi:5'-nucleotidase